MKLRYTRILSLLLCAAVAVFFSGDGAVLRLIRLLLETGKSIKFS